MTRVVRIPLSLKRNSTFVEEVYVEEVGPFRFILSTDTTTTSIDLRVASQIGLEPKEEKKGFGLGGDIPVYPARLKSLRIGDFEVKDLEVLIADLSHVSARLGVEVGGVLACDVLKRYKAVIDYGKKELLLRK
mgnify:CR=1 FL=1